MPAGPARDEQIKKEEAVREERGGVVSGNGSLSGVASFFLKCVWVLL